MIHIKREKCTHWEQSL